MMKLIVTHQTNSVSFEIEKNLPEHEAFGVLRAFTVSAFENLPEPLVYSLAGVQEPFHLQDPKDWKEGVQKHFKGAVICLSVVVPPVESDSESESYVLLTEGGSVEPAQVPDSDDEEETIDTAKNTDVEDSEDDVPPVIEDYEEELEDKQPEVAAADIAEEANAEEEQEGQNASPQSLKLRIMQFIAEIGSEALQNLVAVVHSLVTEGNADLGDAIRTAIETSEKAANHPLVKDLLAILDVYIQKLQCCNWQQMLSKFNIDHVVALIPNIVDAITRSLEGAEHCEIDLAPLMPMMCPLMAQMAAQHIPAGEERVFHADPMNPFAVFQQARETLTREMNEERRRQPEDNLVVHRGITCDGCDKCPIRGVRYKSTTRADFDLCEDCEKDHDPADPLIKIKLPLEDMDMLPGLGEFRRQVFRPSRGRGRGCGFRGWGRGHHARRGRGRGRGCGRMFRQMFENVCPPESGNHCDFEKMKESCKKMGKEYMEKMKTLKKEKKQKCKELEKEKRMKCKELKKQKCKEMKELKKQMKQKYKEMKKVHKEEKKTHKPRAELCAHQDCEEVTTQKPGTTYLHTWQVRNTGFQDWQEETVALFTSGNHGMIEEGYSAIEVSTIEAGFVAHICVVINVPIVPGTYSAVYRLSTPKGKFGPRMRVVVEVPSVVEVAPIAFSSEPGSIPKVIDDVVVAAPSAPAQPFIVDDAKAVVEEPKKEEMKFQKEIGQLKSMGFNRDNDTLQGVLIATKGNLEQAVALLLTQ